MKFNCIIHLLVLLISLTLRAPAHAGWFGWSEGEVNQLRQEHHKELAQAGEQLAAQRKAVETWELAAASLAIGGVLLLIIGTALGTRTRHAAARPTS